MKNYKERDYFILRTRKATFPCQNAFEKCIITTELCNGKAISKSYTLYCSCKCPCMFPYSYA